MTVRTWLGRANRSLRSARLLRDDGDTNAACSEAYYAIFYAARAALLSTGKEREASGKSHSDLVAAFSEHWIKAGVIPSEHGRNFAHALKARLIADYEGDPIDQALAERAIDDATAFVAAVRERAEAPR